MNKYKLNKNDLLNYNDSLGRKLIHEYCIYNNLNGLKELISIIGNNEYLNLVDKFNTTCAHFASRNGNIEILEYLSKNGFKWNEKEMRFGLTPLKLSIAMKHNECVKFLSSYANIESLNESLISSSKEGNI